MVRGCPSEREWLCSITTRRQSLDGASAQSRRGPDPTRSFSSNGGRPVDLASESELTGLPITVIRRERNIGAAAARNLACAHLVKERMADRFVLLDNDTTVFPDFFDLVADSSFEPLEIAAPLILDMDTEKVIYAGGRFDRHRYPSVIPDWPAGETKPQEVEWAPTAGLVFDRDTWLRVGGFDAWYGFSWEDIEWCDRAIRRGAVIRVEPHLRVLHEAHQSSGGPFSPERLQQWSGTGRSSCSRKRRLALPQPLAPNGAPPDPAGAASRMEVSRHRTAARPRSGPARRHPAPSVSAVRARQDGLGVPCRVNSPQCPGHSGPGVSFSEYQITPWRPSRSRAAAASLKVRVR